MYCLLCILAFAILVSTVCYVLWYLLFWCVLSAMYFGICYILEHAVLVSAVMDSAVLVSAIMVSAV